MKPFRSFACTLAALTSAGALAAAAAQTHAVKRQESVVRAIAVYEWTGDQDKPTASRVMPVSLYIGKELRDAGVYRADPVPLALDVGNLFELEATGVPEGTLELVYARHIAASGDLEDDDGWVGYGRVKAKSAEPPAKPLKGGAPAHQVEVSGGRGPHLNTKPTDGENPRQEPPEPVDHSGASGGTVSASGGESGVQDRETGSSDPERPTLRRRTPEQQKQDAKKKNEASVTGVGSLNDDPDRPTLTRGRAPGLMDQVPPLDGLPAGMKQAVAVSDAKDRPEHDFSRAWESAAERATVLTAMQGLARTRLAAYQRGLPVATPQPAAPPSRSTAREARLAGRGAAASHPRPVSATPPAPPLVLTDERLTGFTLSYGGAATYVYTASAGDALSVTIVAQQEAGGPLKQSFASATDLAHLDRTPQVRLVDAVDAEASNRASLLFELRGQTTRQFALYRVIAAEAEQTFATGTIPITQ